MKTIDIIKEHKLKLKKQKCVFFATEVKLIGHLVSGGGKIDPVKIKAILDCQPPI
jgi:hypothetical protein